MKNDITELVFILDRSGSMAGLEQDTIGGFNAMIEKQKRQEGTCYVSTVLFDSRSEMLHDRLPLHEVPKMTEADYTVRGSTALLDAVGDAIHHVERIHKYARSEDIPAHTLFVITTDGMENASHHYDTETIRQMIHRKKRQSDWEFLFIGANIDAVETAAQYGIERDRAVNYHADKRGTRMLYESVAQAVGTVRAHRPLSAEWCEDLNSDFHCRSTNQDRD